MMRNSFFTILILSCLGVSSSRAQLRLVDPNKKAFIEKANSIPILYQNIGNAPITITSVTITQDFNAFHFDSTSSFAKTLQPGETGNFTIYYQAAIAWEFNCDVLITTLIPAHAYKQHIRVNDTVPPNKVQNLHEYPMKSGAVRIAWDPPVPARDGDSIWHYELYVGRYLDSWDSLMAITHETSALVQPRGNGWMTYSVLAWDDMGNKSVVIDTGWTSAVPPQVALAHVDPTSSDVPEHVASGVVPLQVLAKHDHLSYVRVSVKDTAVGSPIRKLTEHWGPLYNYEDKFSYDWQTASSPKVQDLIVYARDSVGNDTTITWRFQLTQLDGWPKFIPHPIYRPGTTTITADGVGPFVLTGSDIANGAFRPSGDLFYNWWPLSVIRPSSDLVVTATAEVNSKSPGLEELVGGANDHALLLSSDGRVLSDLGQLQSGSEVLAFDLGTTTSILAGPSPVAIHDEAGRTHIAGATAMWDVNGNALQFNGLFASNGRYEFDRVVAGSLEQDGKQQFVRAYSAEEGETIAVYDANGKMLPGWPHLLWSSGRSYKGFYPSLGDIDGDGKLEIVIPAPNDSLYVFRMDGSPVIGYPVSINTHDAGHNQALIVDVDGDGAGDIILPANDSIQCINGLEHRPMSGMWPIKRHTFGTTLLTAADLLGDGNIELIESPQVSDTGSWCYTYQLGAKNAPKAIQWGTFQHDMQRSGNFDVGKLSSTLGVTSINESSTSFSLFPQPASKSVQLQLDVVSARSWSTLNVVDVTGRIRVTLSHDRNESASPTVDISGLSSGAYFVTVQTPSGVLRAKLNKL
jgi:hypothetical protein